jgi:hypothetical protein
VLTVIGQARSGAVMAMQAHSAGERCLAAARGVVFYLWKLIWPGWLCPFYPLGGTMSLSQVEFLVPVVLVILISVLVVWLRRRAPALLAAWCSYLALLVPVSGLMQAGSQAVADRFMYLAMLAPLLGLQYAMDGESLAVLTAALLVGTPILSLLGAIGAALTLGLRGSGSLLALLILPLYVPVLIFGAGAVDAARAGLGASANLSLLVAGLLVAMVGAPFAAAAAVRIALD